MASYLDSILDELYGGLPHAGGQMLGRGNFGGTGFGDAGSHEVPFDLYERSKKQQTQQPKKRKRLVDVLFDDLREAPFRTGGGGSGGSGGGYNPALDPVGVPGGGGSSTSRPPVVRPQK